MRSQEPLTGVQFRIEIDGIPDTAAVEVVFPEGRIVTRRGKRSIQYGPLVLRRALTGSNEWYGWWDTARGTRARTRNLTRTVRVTLLDRSQSSLNIWTFQGAEPAAYSVSPLHALVSAPLIETLELSVSGFEAGATASGRATQSLREGR